MGDRRTKTARKKRSHEDLAVQLIVGGAAMLFAPLFFQSNPLLVAMLRPLRLLGGLALAIGLLMIWALKRSSQSPRANGSVEQRESIVSRGSRSEPRLDMPLAGPIVEHDYDDGPHDEADQDGDEDSPPRPTEWSIEVFKVIEWRRLEALVEALFRQGGVITKSQSHGADGGVDIWLYSKTSPDKPLSLVQCKHQAKKKVTVQQVREFKGVMASHDVKRGQYISTSGYTADAAAFANANGINLQDADSLLRLIQQKTPNQQAELLGVALRGEYWRSTCASCGSKMDERARQRDQRRFWKCPACGNIRWIAH